MKKGYVKMIEEAIFVVISFCVTGYILYVNFRLRCRLTEYEYQLEVMKDYSEIIQSYLERRELPDLIEYFQSNRPITIFGLNRFAKVLINDLIKQGVEIKGIIDNFNNEEFMGFKTETFEEYKQRQDTSDALIVICVLRPQAYDIKQNLLGFIVWEKVKTIEELIVDEGFAIENLKESKPGYGKDNWVIEKE